MAKIKGICVNDECELCDQIQEAEKSDFVCSKCEKELVPSEGEREKNKTLIYVIGAAAVIAVAGGATYFLSAGSDTPITKLEIADYDPMLWVGTTDTLTVMPTPADAKATYIWSSSDESVATVMNGVVKAIGEGETTITVKVRGNEDISASAKFFAENYEETPVDEPKGKGQETQKPVSTPASDKLDLGFATYQGDIKNGKPEGNGTMTFKSRHIIPGSKGDVVAEPGEYVVGTWRNGEVNLVTLHQKSGNKPIVTHK